MEDICRVCLSSSVTLMDMFAKRTTASETELSLAQKIMECARCDILENDQLPQKICISCILNAETAFKFKQTCEQSQLILLSKVWEDGTSNLDKTIKLETPEESEMKWEDLEITPEIALQHKGNEKPEVSLEFEQNPMEVLSLGYELPMEAAYIRKTPRSKLKENNVKNSKQGVTKKYKKMSKTQPCKFQCGLCLQIYSSASALRLHRLVHTGERPHECPYCKGRFARKGDLCVHIRMHTGERPYECKQCSKNFSSAAVLSKHRRIHDGDSRLKCPHCPAKFVKQGNFERHLKTHRNSQFIDEEEMEQSPKRMLNKQLEMPKKEQKVGKELDIITEKKENIPDLCASSHKLPTKPESIRRSQKSVEKQNSKIIKNTISQLPKSKTNDRYFECPHCDSKFTRKGDLIVHLRIHTGKKSYNCRHCSKTFKSASLHKKHLRIHDKDTRSN